MERGIKVLKVLTSDIEMERDDKSSEYCNEF